LQFLPLQEQRQTTLLLAAEKFRAMMAIGYRHPKPAAHGIISPKPAILDSFGEEAQM